VKSAHRRGDHDSGGSRRGEECLAHTGFAFASFNAGPGRISQMRKLAQKRGLDSDKWFNNVERVTAEKVGIEITTYVRNIYKYYAAYTLMLEVQEAKKKARESVKQGS